MGSIALINISIELYKGADNLLHVYIADDGSSGCDYLCENGLKDVKREVSNYVENYFNNFNLEEGY